MDAHIASFSEGESAAQKVFGAAIAAGLTALIVWTLVWPGCARAPQVAPGREPAAADVASRTAPASQPAPAPAAAAQPAEAPQPATAPEAAAVSAAPAAPPESAAPAPAAGGLGALVERSLPTGVSLKVPEHGVEGRLMAFITDPGRRIDRKTWFDFDRLVFDTGKATLRPESRDQLRSVAAILKAYPQVRVKIGGYTDDVGSPASNLRLSRQRATGVRRELVALGVAPGRLEAEGYGATHAVADNATPEGRARNRRISMHVLEK